MQSNELSFCQITGGEDDVSVENVSKGNEESEHEVEEPKDVVEVSFMVLQITCTIPMQTESKCPEICTIIYN